MAAASGSDDSLARIGARLEAERQNALGPLRDAAGLRDATEERALRLGADNLLDKAMRRLRDGDEAAARRLTERVLGVSLETSAPGAEGAEAVHLFIWDGLREAVFGRDAAWLDRAATVAATLDGAALREWRAALTVLAAEEEVPPAERRRITAVAGTASLDHEPFERVPITGRVDATLALLRGLVTVAG